MGKSQILLNYKIGNINLETAINYLNFFGDYSELDLEQILPELKNDQNKYLFRDILDLLK